MKSRNVLLTALSLGLTLSAPLAFAQDQTASPTAQEQTAATPATPATPAQPADPAAQTTATPATPASPAEGEAKKVTWSDLDADKDGALTPDEYKAFVAKNQADAAQPQNEG